MFKSPTCTQRDIRTAERMARIANVSLDELGKTIFSNTVDHKSVDEMLFTDYKEFHVAGHSLAVAQLTCVDSAGVLNRKDELLERMRRRLFPAGGSQEETNMNKAKRPAVIAGNWKMNKNRAEAAALITELLPLVKDAGCEVVLCTPYTDLETALALTEGTGVKIGAENCHWAESGAFTGEISAEMLRELGSASALRSASSHT